MDEKVKDLLSKFENGIASFNEYLDFFKIDNKDLHLFFDIAQKITSQHFNNKLKIYIPGNRFPAISITGSKCSLHCEHCNEKYLNSMKSITNSDDLNTFLIDLSKSGGTGALISGGCELDGSVPLINFLDTIKKIKNETNLIINTHTGILNEDTAQKLAEARVDIVSFDINLDEQIIKNIYHLEKDLTDYKKAISLLKKYNLNIVPHICVGLCYGELHEELSSLQFIKDTIISPSLIVIIALIPPKGKEESFKRPNPIAIAKVIALTRFMFPETEISLGCMRPRGDVKVEIEKLAIQAGITRIEIPSTKTTDWLKNNYPEMELKFYSACCSIPKDYESLAKSKEFEIKRYL